MNKRARGGSDPFAGLKPPVPPGGLRESVLKAAGEAMARPVPDRWTFLWQNPTARAAWALTMALLLLGHLFVHLRASAGTAPGTYRPWQAGPELAEAAWLPRINTDLLPFAPNGGAPAPDRTAPGGQNSEKEKTS